MFLINELGECLMKENKMMKLNPKYVSVGADKEYIEGFWKMAQLIMCLLCRHEDLSLNLLHANAR